MVERYHSAYSGSMFPHPAGQYADEYVSGEDYDALATEVATLRSRLAEAEREIQRLRNPTSSIPPNGSVSVSTCGCSSWTDGLGNHGEYKCYTHRAQDSTASQPTPVHCPDCTDEDCADGCAYADDDGSAG